MNSVLATTRYFLDVALTAFSLAFTKKTLTFFFNFLFMLKSAIDECIYLLRIFVNSSIFHQQNLRNFCSLGEDAEMAGRHNDSFLELSNQ